MTFFGEKMNYFLILLYHLKERLMTFKMSFDSFGTIIYKKKSENMGIFGGIFGNIENGPPRGGFRIFRRKCVFCNIQPKIT